MYVSKKKKKMQAVAKVNLCHINSVVFKVEIVGKFISRTKNKSSHQYMEYTKYETLTLTPHIKKS